MTGSPSVALVHTGDAVYKSSVFHKPPLTEARSQCSEEVPLPTSATLSIALVLV